MDVQSFIARVQAVRWCQYNGPQYYAAGRVAPALVALATVETEDFSLQAMPNPPNVCLNGPVTSNVLFAIGNDHCGSYYPAVLGALGFLLEIALTGQNHIARNCAINILIDLYYFSPDASGYAGISSGKLQQAVRGTIRQNIKPLLLAHEESPNKELLLGFASSVDGDEE